MTGQPHQPAARPLPERMTVAQAAAALRLDDEVVRSAMADGTLPTVELDGQLHVDMRQLLAQMATPNEEAQ